ncbi:MAG: hypothetical protein UU10_C0006G0006 [Parcubacteria group bacterium GW2011_GWF1_40_6]|uniref:Uncharacterized protein n=2 Tax=Candidatus Nomuraibacteriota TaxID=1752729 RepID=A0A0G0R0P4_9BACT|nr:MAG: hypothetical protein UT78_C0005G0025 [Candidatus Nomurabacteria bacterium GW2011_GWF2_40_12]KKR69741.1 MAG: hypothetical protein UU10_C0006G0006 [Parcubacteria group bacterium GW2011_GWF1_40_6]OGJ10058.1 MAG: hypothetical protein A2356_01700 [Candidatus Nomurabacteria bacterium RIFOXYB1_FULL_39_16]
MVIENNFSKAKETPISETQGINEAELLSEKRYKKIGETFAMIITQISSLSVPEKTIEEWKILSSSTRIIDNKLDGINNPIERLKFSQKIISFLRGNADDFSEEKDLERSIMGIKNIIAGLEENQRDSFIDSLSNILKITEKIKTEENPKKIAELTRVEGQIAARFYLFFLPREFKLSENYKKLLHAFTRLGRAANSFDSFVDLPEDYKNKEVQIPPTILNRTLFLGSVLSDGLSMMKDIGLSKDLIKRFLLAIKHVTLDAPKKLK